MRLNSVTLRNFRCCKELSVDLSPGFTVFLGSNGSGKSTVLDGLSACLASFHDVVGAALGESIRHEDVRLTFPNHQPRRNYSASVSASGNFLGIPAAWSCELHSAQSTHVRRSDMGDLVRVFRDAAGAQADGAAVSLPVIAAYGIERSRRRRKPQESTNPLEVGLPATEDVAVRTALVESGRSADSKTRAYENALLSGALWEPIRVLWAMALLESSNNGERGRRVADACARTIRRALGDCDSPDPAYMPDVWDVAVSVAGTPPRPVGLMSDGWRGYISLISDLTLKAAFLNPHLDEPALDSEGVVLIDEIDLHLHPALQQVAILQLRRAFPKMQFLVTTHSPLVITGVNAPSGEELLIGDRSAPDRIYHLRVGDDGAPGVDEVPRPIGKRADQTLTGEWC